VKVQKEVTTMAKKKRIHNPENRTCYKVQERTTRRGRKGQILDEWSP
jgi:hypothetical protein